jgi:hypothetical protein
LLTRKGGGLQLTELLSAYQDGIRNGRGGANRSGSGIKVSGASGDVGLRCRALSKFLACRELYAIRLRHLPKVAEPGRSYCVLRFRHLVRLMKDAGRKTCIATLKTSRIMEANMPTLDFTTFFTFSLRMIPKNMRSNCNTSNFLCSFFCPRYDQYTCNKAEWQPTTYQR